MEKTVKKVSSVLRDRRGDAGAGYVSSAVLVIVIALFISFTLQLFSVIQAKSYLDRTADQLTRQIQLSGETGYKTEELFRSLTGGIGSLDGISYSVTTEYYDGNRIQLGTPFEVTVRATGYLGGMGDVRLFPVELVSTGGGVSEEYWK